MKNYIKKTVVKLIDILYMSLFIVGTILILTPIQ